VIQSLGERFVMIRWKRPGGDDGAEQAALTAMNQNAEEMRNDLNAAVEYLFTDLFKSPTKDVTVSQRHQMQIAALSEFAVRARTYVGRDPSDKRNLVYMPEPEAPTRLAQQLCQLAKGSARLGRRQVVNDVDVDMVRRVAFDCIPALRAETIRSCMSGASPERIPPSTLAYTRLDLALVGLFDNSHSFSELGRDLLVRGGATE
jgi:hypothetical protein